MWSIPWTQSRLSFRGILRLSPQNDKKVRFFRSLRSEWQTLRLSFWGMAQPYRENLFTPALIHGILSVASLPRNDRAMQSAFSPWDSSAFASEWQKSKILSVAPLPRNDSAMQSAFSPWDSNFAPLRGSEWQQYTSIPIQYNILAHIYLFFNYFCHFFRFLIVFAPFLLIYYMLLLFFRIYKSLSRI